MTQLEGAKVPLLINGIEYQAHTLTDRDLVELDEYIKSEVINLAFAASKNLTPLERQEVLSAAVQTALRTSWYSEEGNHIISTIKGVARLGWQMAGKPETFNKFYEQVMENLEENISRINIVYTNLHTAEKKGGSAIEPKR